jgi:hypothetical protein
MVYLFGKQPVKKGRDMEIMPVYSKETFTVPGVPRFLLCKTNERKLDIMNKRNTILVYGSRMLMPGAESPYTPALKGGCCDIATISLRLVTLPNDFIKIRLCSSGGSTPRQGIGSH